MWLSTPLPARAAAPGLSSLRSQSLQQHAPHVVDLLRERRHAEAMIEMDRHGAEAHAAERVREKGAAVVREEGAALLRAHAKSCKPSRYSTEPLLV